MVFFFIVFLAMIVVFVFPIGLSATGYYDAANNSLRFAVRFSVFEKPLGGSKQTSSPKEETKSKDHAHSFPMSKKIPKIPLSVVKSARLSVTLPRDTDSLFIFLSCFGALNFFLPIKTECYYGDKFYLETSVEVKFNLFIIFPVIKQTLIKRR